MQELGADEAVNYTEQRFEEVYRDHPFDGVIDAIGGEACGMRGVGLVAMPSSARLVTALADMKNGAGAGSYQCNRLPSNSYMHELTAVENVSCAPAPVIMPLPCLLTGCAADYEARSISVLKKAGVYVSILASGWAKKYGIGGGAALTILGLAKG